MAYKPKIYIFLQINVCKPLSYRQINVSLRNINKIIKLVLFVTETQVQLPIIQKANTQEKSFDWKGI